MARLALDCRRDSKVSSLLQNGEFPAYVQKQAGHKSMDITINVYRALHTGREPARC